VAVAAAAVVVAVAAAVEAVFTEAAAVAVPVVVVALLPVALAVVGRPAAGVFQPVGLQAGLPLVAPVLVADLAVLLVVAVAALLGPKVLLLRAVVAVMPVLRVVAADPCPRPRVVVAADPCPRPRVAVAADPCPRLLEVIGTTTVLPVQAMVLALPSSERLLSRPLPLPLAR
jgi:hypothetical protein